MQQGQSGQSNTGTRDVTYNVVSVMYHALQGVENSRIYAEDAGGDQEVRSFFEQAGQQQRQLAEQAKQILRKCLQDDSGQSGQGSQGSAFSFNQDEQGGGSSSSMSDAGQSPAGSQGSTSGLNGS